MGFSHLHKIHIYLQLSAWAWQMWPEIKIKINGLDRPWMLEACLAAWARLSYKIKRITEAFFQGALPPCLKKRIHFHTYTLAKRQTHWSQRWRKVGYSVLRLSPHIWTFSVSVTGSPSPVTLVLSEARGQAPCLVKHSLMCYHPWTSKFGHFP